MSNVPRLILIALFCNCSKNSEFFFVLENAPCWIINCVLIQPSKRLQGCADDQQTCVHSRVKALKNITYSLKQTVVQSWGCLSLRISLFGCIVARVFSRACSFDLIFCPYLECKIGVQKSPALFQGKELQFTRFKVICFRFKCEFLWNSKVPNAAVNH